MLVLPFVVDQIPNAKKIECEGLGKYVNHKPTLSKEQFEGAIEEILNNHSKYNFSHRRIIKKVRVAFTAVQFPLF
nr:unnamed protein product [Callosobruchus analis]